MTQSWTLGWVSEIEQEPAAAAAEVEVKMVAMATRVVWERPRPRRMADSAAASVAGTRKEWGLLHQRLQLS